MTDHELLTERLLLRRWYPRDHAPFAKMCADPDVMRFIRNGRIMNNDQVAADIADYEAFWDANGFGQFAIELKQTGQFIGFAGLGSHPLLPEYASFTEIGWRLARPMWGRGYATEAAKAVLDFAINDCGIIDIISVCQVENIASEKIMQKLDLVFAGEEIAPNNGRAVKIYALKKSHFSDA